MAERIRKVGKGEEHINDAAARALMVLAHTPRIGEQEFMSMLFSDPSDGLIFRAPFQTQGARYTSQFTGFLPGDPAGLVHNHPFQEGLIPTTQFSATDALTAQQFQEPSFLLAPRRGDRLPEQRKLNPAPKGEKINSDVGKKRGVTGEEFLAQFPVDLLLQLIARDNPIMRALLAERASGNPNTR